MMLQSNIRCLHVVYTLNKCKSDQLTKFYIFRMIKWRLKRQQMTLEIRWWGKRRFWTIVSWHEEP